MKITMAGIAVFERGIMPILEAGLAERVAAHVRAGRRKVTTRLADGMTGSVDGAGFSDTGVGR